MKSGSLDKVSATCEICWGNLRVQVEQSNYWGNSASETQSFGLRAWRSCLRGLNRPRSLRRVDGAGAGSHLGRVSLLSS
jgi:hypothetical protein